MTVGAVLWTNAARVAILVLLVIVGVARLRAGRIKEFEKGRWWGYALLCGAALNLALWTMI